MTAAAYAVEGIPVGEDHRRQLARVAADLGVEVPWDESDATR